MSIPNLKEVFGGATSITITATTLASGSQRSSAAIDNSTNLYLDALVRVDCTLATGTPSVGINVYAYGSIDGTNYQGMSATADNVDGTDKAVTLQSPTGLPLLGTIPAVTAGALVYKGLFSVAKAFGGILPSKWGIVVDNETSLAFTACTCTYNGINYQVT